MPSLLRRTLALLAVSALVLGACSSEEAPDPGANPTDAFTAAIDALQDYEGVTLVMSVQASPESLEALGEEGGDALPPGVADQVISSSLTISARGETAEDSQAEIVLNLAGNETAFEMRVVDQALYARADVSGVAELFGADLSELEAGAAQAEAQGLTFVGPALAGEWIGIEGLDQLAQQLTGQPAPTADAEQQQQIIDSLTNILKENVTVTSEGEDEIGAHLVASLPVRDTVQKLFDTVQELGQVPLGTPPDLSEIPEGDVRLDAWIADGRLVQLEIDFIQFAALAGEDVPEGIDRVALRLAISEFTDDIAAPEGATLIDPQQVFGAMMGGLGTMGSDSSVGTATEIPELGLNCSDLQGLRPVDLEAYLEELGQPELFESIQAACPGQF